MDRIGERRQHPDSRSPSLARSFTKAARSLVVFVPRAQRHRVPSIAWSSKGGSRRRRAGRSRGSRKVLRADRGGTETAEAGARQPGSALQRSNGACPTWRFRLMGAWRRRAWPLNVRDDARFRAPHARRDPNPHDPSRKGDSPQSPDGGVPQRPAHRGTLMMVLASQRQCVCCVNNEMTGDSCGARK